jgi:hypothetical protein
MKHKMKDGTEIEISAMTDSHLINTCRRIKKKADAGLVVRHGSALFGEEPWYDEDHLFGQEAMEKLNYDWYEKELENRGLKHDEI